MEQFPVILIPSAIEEAKLKPAPLLPKPQPPIKPELPKPPAPEPQPVKKLDVALWLLVCLVFSFLVGILSANISSLQIGQVVGFTTLLLSTGKVAYNAWQEQKSFPKRKEIHEQKQRRYLFKRDLYHKALKEFEAQEKQYQAEFDAYKKEYGKSQKLKEAGREHLRQVLSQVSCPDGKDSNAKRGLSEPDFEKFLHRHFPDKIHTGWKMQNPSYGSQYFYTADFTYFDETINLYIDIEVDEPYGYKRRNPLHYIGLETEITRNQFFTDNLWVVIRFSEEQVVRYPNSCCKTIAEVIAGIMGAEALRSNFNGVPRLESMPRWTYEQAKHMAASDYRQTYLKAR